MLTNRQRFHALYGAPIIHLILVAAMWAGVYVPSLRMLALFGRHRDANRSSLRNLWNDGDVFSLRSARNYLADRRGNSLVVFLELAVLEV